MKRYILSLLILAAGICSSNADTITATAEKTITAGDSVTVNIKLGNSVSRYYGIQFDISLAGGLSLTANDKGNYVSTVNRLNDFTTQNKELVANHYYRILSYSSSDKIAAGDDDIISFKIKTDASLTSGVYLCYLFNVAMCDDDYTDKPFDDVVFEVNINNPVTPDYQTLSLSDTDTDLPRTSTELYKYSISRAISAGKWNTLVLPFSLTPDEVINSFGSAVQVSQIKNWSMDDLNSYGHPTQITLNFEDYDFTTNGLEANHPYLIKTGINITTIRTDEAKLLSEVPSQPSVSFPMVGSSLDDDKGRMYGTYIATKVPYSRLFISSNTFYYSVGNSTLKGYRAYIYLPYVAQSFFDNGSNAKISFVLDDAAVTGINDVETIETTAANTKVYNLSGQYVGDDLSNLPSGIYIQAGKKVYVK